MRVQRHEEPVDNFITDLFSLAEHCEFGARIVVGLADKSQSERLQLEADLTMEKGHDTSKAERTSPSAAKNFS